MTFLRRLWFYLTRARRTAELDEEMRLHRELREAANHRRGLEPTEAARLARVRFGNPLTWREESHETWGFGRIDALLRDLDYGGRQLRRRPTWTATVVLTLALGVGANTAMFTLLDALLFRPSAGRAPEELVRVTTVEEPSGALVSTSYPNYVDLRNQAHTLSGVMAYAGNGFSIGGPSSDLVFGNVVSVNYFDVLGIHAALGRTFRLEEDQPAAPAVAVLSDALWQTHFGGSPAIVGETVPINGQPVTVIGIAQPGFTGTELGQQAALWMPLAQEGLASGDPRPRPHLLDDREAGWLRVVGRRRTGVSVAQVQADLSVVSAGLPRPTSPHAVRPSVAVSSTVGGLEPGDRVQAGPVLALIAIVPLFVLAVACANVANLVMAQHVARQREFAMRRAIGASRLRLIRQLVAESALLALLSATAGLASAVGLTAVLAHIGALPEEITRSFLWSGRVFLATILLALATTAIFGWIPALTASRVDLTAVLKDEGGAATAAPRRARLRGVFVVAQVSLSLSLLVAAGLFLQSLTKALAVDPGFVAHGAVSLTVDPQKHGYSAEGRDLFASALVGAASALPGVSAAGTVLPLPLSGENWHQRVAAEDSGPARYVQHVIASPGYFGAIGTSILEGRAFTHADTASSTPVAIVNEPLARRLWPGRNPLGQRLLVVFDRSSDRREVIGVARDGKYFQLTEEPQDAFYTPSTQERNQADTRVSVVVRATGDPHTLLRSLTSAVRGLDPELPVSKALTLDELAGEAAEARRAVASLLGFAGVMTLIIAAIGIYGVTAHGVSLRRREVGIRMALGARLVEVRRLFVIQSLRLTGVGVAIGLLLSAGASRLLTTFLFGLKATDLFTFVGSAVVILAVAAVASYLPARQASRVDPVASLRQD